MKDCLNQSTTSTSLTAFLLVPPIACAVYFQTDVVVKPRWWLAGFGEAFGFNISKTYSELYGDFPECFEPTFEASFISYKGELPTGCSPIALVLLLEACTFVRLLRSSTLSSCSFAELT